MSITANTKFATFEEARAALGIPAEMVNDANRPIIERLVLKNTPSSSKTKRELLAQAEAVGVLQSKFAKDHGVTDLKNENVYSLLVLIAYAMFESNSAELDAFLEKQGWAFCDRNDTLYRLKRKAVPVSDRNLPKQGSAGYEMLKMVGLKEFRDMEFADMVNVISEIDGPEGKLEITEKTAAFYANLAKNRQEDCKEIFGSEWDYMERTSVILSHFGGEVDIEKARATRRTTTTEA